MAGEYLRVTSGSGAGTMLAVGRELLLGRAVPDEDVLAGDLDLSREHARVTRDVEGRLKIEDLESRNGTFVNGVGVQTQTLSPGDAVGIGATTLEVVVRPPSRLYDDEVIRPWYDHAVTRVPALSLFDVHGHVGSNDPDGFRFSTGELLDTLEAAGSRGVVMPMHEPDGYPPANDRLLAPR